MRKELHDGASQCSYRVGQIRHDNGATGHEASFSRKLIRTQKLDNGPAKYSPKSSLNGIFGGEDKFDWVRRNGNRRGRRQSWLVAGSPFERL